MTKKNFKTGRLSKGERDYIRENWLGAEPQVIADHLNRRLVTVEKWALQASLNSSDDDTGVSDSERILGDLHRGARWKSLKKRFNRSELTFFEEQWVKFIKQFNKDVLPTEALQITTVITLEILINRNLEDRNQVGINIDKLKAEKEGFLQQMSVEEVGSDKFHGLSSQVQMAEIQVANAESSIQSRTVEFKDLVEKQRQYYRDLKATRDQRFKQLEDSRTNYMDWFKELDEKETLEREGREMALRLKAESKVGKKLSELHQFQDGMIDRPILTPEIVEGSDV